MGSKKIIITLIYNNEAKSESVDDLARNILRALVEYGLSPDDVATNAILVEDNDESPD